MSLQVDFDLATDRTDEDLEDGAGLIYVPNILSHEDAEMLFQQLRSSIAFEQRYVTIYDKRIEQPRLTAWYADAGCDYTYGGETHNSANCVKCWKTDFRPRSTASLPIYTGS